MLNTIKKIIGFAGLYLTITACQTFKLADDVALLAISSELTPGTQAGVLAADHCGIRVLGFGTNADFTGTLRNFRARYPSIRYLTRVRIERRYNQYAVWEHDCWSLRGLGYQ